MSHLKAVYFIRPTSENIQKLRYQLANPRFGEHHLFFSNLLKDTQIHILADSDEHDAVQQVQEFYADFVAGDPYHFTLNMPSNHLYMLPAVVDPSSLQRYSDRVVDGIAAVFLALKRRPVIRYQRTYDTAKRIAHETAKLMYQHESRRRYTKLGIRKSTLLFGIDGDTRPWNLQQFYTQGLKADSWSLLIYGELDAIIWQWWCLTLQQRGSFLESDSIIMCCSSLFSRMGVYKRVLAGLGLMDALIWWLIIASKSDFLKKMIRKQWERNITEMFKYKRMSKYKSRMHRQDTEVSEYKVELAEVSITSCELSEEGIGFHVLSMKFTQLIFNWGCIDIHLISSICFHSKRLELLGLPRTLRNKMELLPLVNNDKLVGKVYSVFTIHCYVTSSPILDSENTFCVRSALSSFQESRVLSGVENVYTQHQPLLFQTMESITRGRFVDKKKKNQREITRCGLTFCWRSFSTGTATRGGDIHGWWNNVRGITLCCSSKCHHLCHSVYSRRHRSA
uniref:Uncharacterized protein n=1 Tax=Brassica campestris TaxID=3711 RepID=A0A3P6BD31_BRACM|nr:unnamed protein product [Brassica rapa]